MGSRGTKGKSAAKPRVKRIRVRRAPKGARRNALKVSKQNFGIAALARELAEAMRELGVRAGPVRASGDGDEDRLQQVRLPDAVGAGHEDQPGHEIELELGVGAEVPKRDVPDDQPASRIGMIRYRKSSDSPRMSPGLSGLMSLKRTASSATDSRPSRRNSALKPISIVSPE